MDELLRRGLILEYCTLAWNLAGCGIVLSAAISARSVALGGFGLDSIVEIAASGVVVWQLKGIHKGRERRALRFIGAAFFSLAAYILVQSVKTLWTQTHPSTSILGIGWLMLTLLAMLTLAAGKSSTGMQLQNSVLITEARVTLIDAFLAGSVLSGLLLNTFLGWWWADPLAGLVIVFYGVKEGRHAWMESA